jgi:8-oxo-dGTP pyrophosphatase MutT (NUDIX family)
MHRQALLDSLKRYRVAYPGETATVDKIVALVQRHADCLLRTCIPGHITASVWIVDSSQQRFLLTHHRKLQRWLQLGGHVDGESSIAQAALREAQEESGITHFDFALQDNNNTQIIDVDVHTIPAHGGEPEHEHHDIRYLLIAQSDELNISAESLDLRWFERHELQAIADEESILRLARKAFAHLDRDRPWQSGLVTE